MPPKMTSADSGTAVKVPRGRTSPQQQQQVGTGEQRERRLTMCAFCRGVARVSTSVQNRRARLKLLEMCPEAPHALQRIVAVLFNLGQETVIVSASYPIENGAPPSG